VANLIPIWYVHVLGYCKLNCINFIAIAAMHDQILAGNWSNLDSGLFYSIHVLGDCEFNSPHWFQEVRKEGILNINLPVMFINPIFLFWSYAF